MKKRVNLQKMKVTQGHPQPISLKKQGMEVTKEIFHANCGALTNKKN